MRLACPALTRHQVSDKGWITASVALMALVALCVLMAFPLPAVAAPDVPLITSRSTPRGTEYSL
ncbi:MAG: hypothetical protein RI949_1547, partial [Pseudomonadota bacterium]